MRFWDKSVALFKCVQEHGQLSIRCLAEKTGLSKSSVHRLSHAMNRRALKPESWFWETDDGRAWLGLLVVATLYLFGLKRGVGAETISEFFRRLHLHRHVGSSPTAIRTLLQGLETIVIETATSWEQEGVSHGQARDIIGAVDETFFEQMLLVFVDLPTGYIVMEEVAEDRRYVTWNTHVQAQLEELGTSVRYLVSDRAKALIQLAQQGLECLSVPDLFHLMRDLSKGYSLAIARPLRQARQELIKAEAAMRRHEGFDKRRGEAGVAHRHLRATQALVSKWEEARAAYRQHLEALSLTMHPFAIGDPLPQSSAQVERRLRAELKALEALADTYQLPAKPEVMKKVSDQVPALAALVDFWWQGVARDLTGLTLTPLWRRWVKEVLLPHAYWEAQLSRSRHRGQRAKISQTLEQSQERLDQHAMTRRIPARVLADWKTWATEQARAFQRASSAVEGRNGYLSQMHHNHRGLPKRRYRTWRALHNFDCHDTDGTTPASRFFRHEFPDFFEAVFAQVGELPRPRQRKRNQHLSQSKEEVVPA